MSNTRVLIIGASGLVGGNCLKHFSDFDDYEVLGTHFGFETPDTVFFDTLNISNPDNQEVLEWNPDVIIHCGALTHVDYCEQNPDESYEKTVVSTQNVIRLCREFNSKLVYISSDYVFDGEDGPYRESDEVNPLSVYGKHKFQAENLVRDYSDKHLVLRITTVYGREIRNKNFVMRIVDQIREGKELTLKLPVDQYASPVNAWDLARAAQLLARDQHSGTFHIGSTDYLNRCQLTDRILKNFPGKVKVYDRLKTEELGQAAPRPLFGGFISEKFLTLYPDFVFNNIDDFLHSLKKND